MIRELRKWVVPELKRRGFGGSFPHYRRIDGTRIDLLMFQFDKWGGGFRIGISYILTAGKRNNLSSGVLNDDTPLEKLTVGDTNIRHMLFPKRHDGWFCYYDVAEIKSGKSTMLMTVKPAERQIFIDSYTSEITWVQIADDLIYENLAKEALGFLDEAEGWWKSMPQESSTLRLRNLFRNIFK